MNILEWFFSFYYSCVHPLERENQITCVRIADGETGYSYASLFGEYLDKSVHRVEIEDPYIRASHQVRRRVVFRNFALRNFEQGTTLNSDNSVLTELRSWVYLGFSSPALLKVIKVVMRKWFYFSKKEIVRIADLEKSSTFCH